MPIKDGFRSPSGKVLIANARVNNLQNVSVDIPIGVLTVVTGVATGGGGSASPLIFASVCSSKLFIE
jgi:excinuclease UvrABC ATPase subunit